MIRDGFQAAATGTIHGTPSAPDFWLRRETDDPVDFSHTVSAHLGRPILVGHLDSPADPVAARRPLDGREISARADALRRLALAALPLAHDRLWSRWNWEQTACATGATCDYIVAPYAPPEAAASVIAPRLEGDCWVSGGIIVMPDRRWSNAGLWGQVSGIPADEIEYHPAGGGLRDYLFLHEMFHAVQRKRETRSLDRRETPNSPDFDAAWRIEHNADQGALDAMLAVARHGDLSPDRADDLRETVIGIAHSRALNSFLNLAAHYWFAAALDTGDGTPPSFPESPQRHWLALLELRLRVHAALTGFDVPRDSLTLQQNLTDWRSGCLTNFALRQTLDNAFGLPFAWGGHSLESALSALRAVAAEDAIDAPLTKRLAGMVIAGAEYFRPSLRPARPCPPRGVPTSRIGHAQHH